MCKFKEAETALKVICSLDFLKKKKILLIPDRVGRFVPDFVFHRFYFGEFEKGNDEEAARSAVEDV